MDYSLLTEQKISEQYKDLPQDLQSALSSANTSITIENIAATYGLNKEQSTMLVQLVGLTLLKFVSFEEMKTQNNSRSSCIHKEDRTSQPYNSPYNFLNFDTNSRTCSFHFRCLRR